MQAVKQEALDTIARPPEDADVEEIMYRLHVLKNIRRGQRDAAKAKHYPLKRCSEIFKHGEMDGSCLGAASAYRVKPIMLRQAQHERLDDRRR